MTRNVCSSGYVGQGGVRPDEAADLWGNIAEDEEVCERMLSWGLKTDAGEKFRRNPARFNTLWKTVEYQGTHGGGPQIRKVVFRNDGTGGDGDVSCGASG